MVNQLLGFGVVFGHENADDFEAVRGSAVALGDVDVVMAEELRDVGERAELVLELDDEDVAERDVADFGAENLERLVRVVHDDLEERGAFDRIAEQMDDVDAGLLEEDGKKTERAGFVLGFEVKLAGD